MNQSQMAAEIAAHAETIRTMDGLAQDGFGRIAAMARVALLAFESEVKSQNLDAFAGVFEAIRVIAEDVENCINVEAEQVGCNYVDPVHARRGDAVRRAAVAAATSSGRDGQ